MSSRDAATSLPAGAMAERTGTALDVLRAEEERLLACVHCGFCLNACPTYTRLGDEADSPRGRLVLMRAVAEGRLEADSEAFARHIDQCLGCRACETVCPSGVEYGFLLERARTVIAAEQGTGWLTRMLLAGFANRSASFASSGLGRLLRAGGLAGALARLTPLRFGTVRTGLAMLAATRPWPALRRGSSDAGLQHQQREPVSTGPVQSTALGQPGEPLGPDSPAGDNYEFADPHARAGEVPMGTGMGEMTEAGDVAGAARPRVAILRGCVQDGLFGRVNEATLRVLRANGCEIVDVPEQACCGALHAHSGKLGDAHDLARRNIAAYEAAGIDYVIVNAAGCGAMMKEYGAQLERDPEWRERAARFSTRVRDLFEFLVERGVSAGAPLPLRVTYDAPCHLHHGQRITRAPLDVLASIPSLELVPLEDAEECCGGAGVYGIQHPELGGRIVNDKLDAIARTGAQVVVTPNPGCIMQIGAGLVLRGDDRPVLHPIELLDESYRRAGVTGE
ncbi:MAG TPA: heterodisulfide reductase-related iron-sulfur binding cluster [Longimicrobiales bacterium]|nr:heterodisulfide reductase-related iron-sulfur binding cluster [Longimicrobiales bacterium]